MRRRRKRFEAQLVGLWSRNEYPVPFVTFRDREEGENWCRANNKDCSRLTRWELVEL